LKDRLKDFIPFNRFFNLTKDQYTFEVWPFENLLPDDLRDELKKFFELNGEQSPPKGFLPPRVPISQTVPDSVLINNKQLALLASWIDSTNNDEFNFNIPTNVYEFNLLLRGSRDGMKLKDFDKLCLNKGPTLVVIKVKGTGQIIGGYNPESWDTSFLKLKEETFIFSLGTGKSFNYIILSRANYGDHGGIYSSIGFKQLIWFRGYYERSSLFPVYEKEIMDGEYFNMEDYEVFQVVKKDSTNIIYKMFRYFNY